MTRSPLRGLGSGARRAGESAPTFSEEECEALAGRVLEMVETPTAQVEISGTARSTTRFARGDAHVGAETSTGIVQLQVGEDGHTAAGSTDQLDDAGLETLVADVQDMARQHRTPSPWSVLPPQVYPKGPQIFFDSTVAAMAGDVQAEYFRQTLDAAEAADLIAAGDVAQVASARAVLNSEGLWAYERFTYGQFSVTARTRDGTGSGWAWGGYEDWARVDVPGTIARAVALGRRSANPVAVEPGRYTVILEPAAVAELVQPIIGWQTGFWNAQVADNAGSVFSGEQFGTNKIGLQMMDRRLGMVSDPHDPERPASTISNAWTPVQPVTWFDSGILENLAYSPAYAREKGREPVTNPGGVRLFADGPSQSLEEMIAGTRRGIWVNRLSHVNLMDRPTLLLTGTTRDGTFLIENGEITKPIKNFRFTESPFFVFNQLEAWGDPVRASFQVVVPRLKLRDFNFSSLTDAI